MNFRIKEKLMLWVSGSKKNLFQCNKLAQKWYFHSIYEAWTAHEMRKEVAQLYIKNNVKFSLAWNIILFDNFKSYCFKIFENKEHGIFEPKTLMKICLLVTKKFVITFWEMGNTVFSWAKTLTKIWYLLITENFLF